MLNGHAIENLSVGRCAHCKGPWKLDADNNPYAIRSHLDGRLYCSKDCLQTSYATLMRQVETAARSN